MCVIFASAISNGLVVQLVRMPACHAGGRGFDPRPLRHLLSCNLVESILIDLSAFLNKGLYCCIGFYWIF